MNSKIQNRNRLLDDNEDYRRGYLDGYNDGYGDVHYLKTKIDSMKIQKVPVAYLRLGEPVPVLNVPFGAMWITDENDPKGFAVYKMDKGE